MLSGKKMSKHTGTASNTLLSVVEASGITLGNPFVTSEDFGIRPMQHRTGNQLGFLNRLHISEGTWYFLITFLQPKPNCWS